MQWCGAIEVLFSSVISVRPSYRVHGVRLFTKYFANNCVFDCRKGTACSYACRRSKTFSNQISAYRLYFNFNYEATFVRVVFNFVCWLCLLSHSDFIAINLTHNIVESGNAILVMIVLEVGQCSSTRRCWNRWPINQIFQKNIKSDKLSENKAIFLNSHWIVLKRKPKVEHQQYDF